MATFTVEIPEELLPGLVAELSTIPNPPSPEEYFQAGAIELLRQRCETYRVGPYYVGAIPPQFNQDGTPFQPPAPAPEPGSVEDTVASGVDADIVAGGDQPGE